jgi:hypothetical protein
MNPLTQALVICVGPQRAQHTSSQIVIITVIDSGRDLGDTSRQPVGYKTQTVA